jgi:serine/threonine protein kinase
VSRITPPKRSVGIEPIPGYRLIERLGEGGFGEVWKCEAPGGLFKAIKFVHQGDAGGAADQELSALQKVKLLRHPFILSMDRVEVIDGSLLIVMELADDSLHSLMMRKREGNQPGIPRDEALSYLTEAAEALDWMNFHHGLQHLDVKPHNLFLISNHVKVADFGLVHSVGDSQSQEGARAAGGTPLYSAPELLRGTLSRHSDQYSLAVVYQQITTGTVPFWHTNIYDLMMQHLTGEPDLTALPESDRPIVLRALSKMPERRFASCSDLIQALNEARPRQTGRRSGQWRRIVQGPSEVGNPDEATPFNASDREEVTRPVRPLARPSGVAPELEQTRYVAPSSPSAAAMAALSQTTLTAGIPAALESTEGMPSPTAASLPGYRFVTCLSQTQFGDLWMAEDNEGRKRRALALLGFVRYNERLIAHLKALRDPVLPSTEVHWSPAERLVLLSDPYDGTLKERFEECCAAGQPGIPRETLLTLLRSAAEALDGVFQRHGLQHLGLNPRVLLLDDDLVRIADFGLVPLVWLPTGESAATLNPRYSAPELFDRKPSRTADQYSLALIYAEMLTGVHPRPNRPGGSGIIRRPTPGTNKSTPGIRRPRLDLDLLPAHDREVVARALSSDPEERFPSCLAFVTALEQAGKVEPARVKRNLYETLPAVVPFASLMGEPAGPDAILPAVSQLVTAVAMPSDPRTVLGPQNVRYTVHNDGTWEYRCPLQLFPGAMALKVEGFRAWWGARVNRQLRDNYTLELDVPIPRSFWERFLPQKKLEVEILVEPSNATGMRLAEALVRLRYQDNDPNQRARIMTQMGPKVMESVRQYLQATQENRSRERFPLRLPVSVYPILPDLDLGAPIAARSRNISFGGMALTLPEAPTVEWLYLHLPSQPATTDWAILARVVRSASTEEGWELGVMFPHNQPRSQGEALSGARKT